MLSLFCAILFDPTKLAISGGALLVVLAVLLIYLPIADKIRQKRKAKEEVAATTDSTDDVPVVEETSVPTKTAPVMPVVPTPTRHKVTVEEAREKVTDEYAKRHVEQSLTPIVQQQRVAGGKKAVVNIDTISANFYDGETVDIAALKAKGLVGKKYTQVKVLARGYIDKSLTVVADDFSVDAVKMILLAEGTAKHV